MHGGLGYGGRGDSSTRGRDYFRSPRGRGGRGDGPPDSKYHKQVSDEAEEEVRELFQKKYTFKDELNEWVLPGPQQVFQESVDFVDELEDLKLKLNSVKSKLDNKDLITWHKHTKFTNKAANIIPAVRAKFRPELCTQGWTKMQEILTTFDIVPHRDVRLNSLHLCEAPGAFITSLNHFLKTHREDIIWDWKAMTLNPYYEGNDLKALIDQDRFMLMTNNSSPPVAAAAGGDSGSTSRWFVGNDNSGDVMVWDNVVGLVNLIRKEMKDVNLVTADGSIDCVNNPAEQEDMVAQLIFCEVFAALKVLKEGGNFVLKTFTTLECQTICIMYLLNTCFREVSVFKPVTSKSGNSEQYIICLKYKSKVITASHWERLKLGFGSLFSSTAIFPLMLPKSFLDELKSCTKKFANYQINAIEENIRLYECMKFSEKKLILEIKDSCCSEYMSRCKLKTMPRDKAILQTIHMDGMYGLHSVTPASNDSSDVLERRSSNSLLGRLQKMQQPWSEVVKEEGGLIKLDEQDGNTLSNSDAAKHVLSMLGCSALSKADENGRDLEDQSAAAVGIDVEPEDVLMLKNHSKNGVDKQDLNTLNGRRVKHVTNSRFCRNDSLKKLINATLKADVIKSFNKTQFDDIASRCLPCHALLSMTPQFYLDGEALNMAAIDSLTGIISQAPSADDHPLTFVDLWGAPSSYGQYIYWTRANSNVKGWGVKRSEKPTIATSHSLAELIKWDSFQILGSVQGLNITNNDTIKSIIATVEADCPNGVQLVFGDLSSVPFDAHHPGTEEYLTKQQLLAQCVLALSLLTRGGSFVIRVYSLLTRFTVGLFYLLYKVFQEVSILKPFTSSPASPEQYIVCRGFNGCQSVICELLLVVNNQIAELRQKQLGGMSRGGASDDMDVLEIFPIQLLLEENFYQYITKRNEKTALLQTHTIMLLEHYRINPQKLPPPDLQDKLWKGLLELLKLPATMAT